jgi:predicted P-loop ATPase
MEYKFKEESIYNPFNESNLYVELLSNNYNTSQANLTALLRSDFVLSFDPIKDYFKELPAWDQKTDYIKQLCDFIKINDHTRFDNHFKKALVRCIACTLDGYINKHAFILIGGQSSGKTYLTRWLCPDPLKDYIAENINTDKDSLIALSENFFIIMDELASLAKKEINSLKSIFTKDKVKVRRPFDRRVTTTVRRANFFGSTNNEEFLSDETGSVRWLCFKIDSIDFNYSNVIDKNGLWTQAYHLYKNGYKYELTREELLENEIINSNHQNSTQEIELIQKHYEPSNEATGGKFVTPTDIMNQLGTKYGNNIRISNVGLGKALTFLKFERVTRKQNNGKFSIKGYFVFENFE